MSPPNPYLPPTFTVESRPVASLTNIVAAFFLKLVAILLGLIVVVYVLILGFEWSTVGANVLPTALIQINVVGISSVCGLIAAIMAARCFSRGKNRILRMLLVFFVLAAIANISVAAREVYYQGQQQTKAR